MNLTRRLLLGAAATLPMAKARAAFPTSWPSALVMGAGQPGSSFTIYGQAWGRLITANTGMRLVYAATDGGDANLLLIEEGTTQLGLCTLPEAIEAHNGTGNWTAGAKLQRFRVLFPTFPLMMQIVARADGIATLAGLNGQKIGVGPAGNGTLAQIQKLFTSQGIMPSQLATGEAAPQLTQLLQGQLAACAFLGAPPLPALKAIAGHDKLRLIGFSSAQARRASQFVPGFSRMILKAGTFPGQTIDVGSIGTMGLAVGSAALPDELVKALTLVALQHRTNLDRIMPAAAQPMSLHSLKTAGLPFHPGALKALQQLDYG